MVAPSTIPATVAPHALLNECVSWSSRITLHGCTARNAQLQNQSSAITCFNVFEACPQQSFAYGVDCHAGGGKEQRSSAHGLRLLVEREDATLCLSHWDRGRALWRACVTV